uniref:Putative mucin 19 n=1 Tax=Anopheles braziliensis TaxID=58242 RepID=A0A2M3YZ61_9DIPT
MDVTLIVKASNQQCEDLTIKCEPSWTIRRLKGHLTEVYPGKPSTDEQKLIYSGQLLSDSVVLKDVLRQYEGQQAHTVHLVFTPKNHYYGSNSNGSTSGPSKSSTTSRMSTSQSQGTGSNSSSSSVTSNGSSSDAGTQSAQAARERDSELEQPLASSLSASDREGLRQRITRPALRTLPGPPAFMQETAALQNLVQQSYMQYLNQYINLLNAGQNNVSALYSPSGVLPAMGTGAASLQTLTGTSDNVATVPMVPIHHPAPVAISGLPTAYYPCMMPSGSGIPTSMGAAGSFIASTSLSSPSLAASSPATATPTAPAQTPFSAPAGPSSSSSATHSDSSSSATLATGGETSANTGVAAAAAAAPSQAGEQEAVAGGEVAAGGAAAAVPAARAARRFPNIVVEEQDNNDWLDVFFSMCRVLILMTVIYLYSSPMRCLTVLVIGVMLYLKKHFDRIYQAVDRRVTNAQQPVAAAAAAGVPGVQQNNAAEAPLLQQNAPDMGDNAPAAAPAAEENNQPERSAGTDASPSGSSSTSSRPTLPRPRTELAASGNNRTAEAPVAPEQREPAVAEVTAANNMEEVATEGQRMTFNDMTSFLGTLVITFFTSIIPDTPAA